ncbi:MAG: hypothetical protein E7J62_18135 [Serratia marcescens]|uniref:hypothetical protein n=1 Tax=Serratia marcescens TaxID=615 RepID=UPI001A28FC8E|nr:hypothetical protein [Serratia marcescens]HAU5737677.1 hypothetical protein [Serratia marcescens]
MGKRMTVKKLIAALIKMPPGHVVVFSDHDQSADEYNDEIRSVAVSDELSERLGCGVVELRG